ncbi:LysM peptidoglycan-binding domain-containing protein [Luteolibacter algae]|uniref:LysM peptidoglycan-binding domain-containing protein n=1 Tax=Luteolibacter algae TaxID=454151 RepID=A0ABW5D8E0_9BACT
MKFNSISTRRKPVRKTVYARIFNKTATKKQRASATAASADEIEDSGINISRSLTIIFAIHILAIGMIFIHKQYLSERTPAPDVASSKSTEVEITPDSSTAASRNNDLPLLSNGDERYMVRQGDNYAIIAEKFQVDESKLRELNSSADIRAGAVLRIPQGKRIVAVDPPEVAAIRNQTAPTDSERGLVEILPPVDVPKAKIVRPALTQSGEEAVIASSGRTHTIKSGENIWRISNQYKVSQQELMKLNNISDPTKLKIGQVIKLP